MIGRKRCQLAAKDRGPFDFAKALLSEEGQFLFVGRKHPGQFAGA